MGFAFIALPPLLPLLPLPPLLPVPCSLFPVPCYLKKIGIGKPNPYRYFFN
ncbi:hypothetical protein PL9631_660067 [Planktothrix paucivesiculata PCC 9631]|uniref:Uncharacterized protein n=1 Tax=Planktothrix paucivesiculata PCC 9631 TaxID=671071 RepID=A0A7Z9E1F0_9CYAN|nr:hypothetical protein PL9631_660067 [Planktothrix paucivesiculata PCC 9631]